MPSTTTAISFAASAAIVALAAAAPTAPAFAKGAGDLVHCYGINTCKGTSDCKTAHNDCKGQNACKGQGFKEMTAKKCTAAGGSLTAK
jgi:uncharacterized membrane protein